MLMACASSPPPGFLLCMHSHTYFVFVWHILQFPFSLISVTDLFLLICQNILFLKSSIIDFINKVFEACGHIADIKVGLKTILEPIKILDKENAKNLEIKNGRISIKNITFGYKR